MGSVTIKDKTFHYTVQYDCSEYGDYYWTEFYQETYTKTYKKYWLFGPTLTREIPIILFKLGLNIEDKCFTKKDIKERLDRQIELLEREEEIKRGEII